MADTIGIEDEGKKLLRNKLKYACIHLSGINANGKRAWIHSFILFIQFLGGLFIIVERRGWSTTTATRLAREWHASILGIFFNVFQVPLCLSTKSQVVFIYCKS